MKIIIIRTVGNPGLYRDLQAAIASESRHRTATGALRRIEKIVRDSVDWRAAMGKWGHVEIQIDGAEMEAADVDFIINNVGDYLRCPQDSFARRSSAAMLASP